MRTFEVNRVLDVKAELGEALLWSVAEQALFWVDIHKQTFNRFDPSAETNKVWPLPAIPGCFSLRDGGAVIATDAGYYDFDFKTEALKLIAPVPFDANAFRFNDGKTDRQGRFWAGMVFKNHWMDHAGSFFRFEKGVVVEGLKGITIANGTAFSPDGRTMYRSESAARTIYKLDYDPLTGNATNEREFASLPDGLGIPDGATVDAEGFYWCAAPFGADNVGHVLRFSPAGEMVLKIPLPVPGVTIVTFGGRDLSTLYVCSGKIEWMGGCTPAELSGDIFAIETPYRGIPEPLCRLR